MRKTIFSFLTLVALLSLGGATLAQTSTDGDFPCLGLEQEDCDLYYDLAEPDVPDSASFVSSNDISVTAEGQTYNGNIELSGSYIYNVTVVEDYLDSLADVPLLDATLGDFIGYLESGIDAFDAELSLVVNAPEQFAMFIPMETIALDLWLVEGDAYADLTPIGQIAGDPALSGVYGIDLFEFVYFGLENVTVGDLTDAFGEIDLSELDFDRDELEQFQRQLEANLEASTADPEDLEAFTTVTRLENETIDGTEVAVFETTIDFQALFESDLVIDSITSQMPEEDFEELGVEIEEIIGALQEAIGDDATFVQTDSYGIEDGYLYSSIADFSITFDPAPFAELEALEEELTDENGETVEPDIPDPITVEASLTVTRSDFNAVEEITLPEDAEVVPLEDLMNGPPVEA